MNATLFRAAAFVLLLLSTGVLFITYRAVQPPSAPAHLAPDDQPSTPIQPRARKTAAPFKPYEVPTIPPAAPAKPAPRPGAAPAQQSPEDPALDLDDEALLMIEVARAALPFVGLDDEAEQIWLVAINDPNLDPESRKDLIEDLNEDGFPDPKNLTEKDLPLIEARLALIDKFAPDAMDDTNAEAFKEARKDLTAMRAKLRPELPQVPAE